MSKFIDLWKFVDMCFYKPNDIHVGIKAGISSWNMTFRALINN